MVDAAVRHSPTATPGGLWRLAAPLTRFSLRVDISAAAATAAHRMPLATMPCRSTVLGEWAALWLGPDEQLLIGPDSMASVFAATVRETLGDLPHSLVDISHR
ncbi:MAG TPA: hypothetical protein VGN77_05175, partial [Steroidobacteraceae bacterium]|nr:hypothetical protein [Steroidobacteraceae bacterium]